MILSYISSTFQLIIPSQWCWFVLIIFISVLPSTPNHHFHFRNIFLILLHSQITYHPLLILLQLSLYLWFFFVVSQSHWNNSFICRIDLWYVSSYLSECILPLFLSNSLPYVLDYWPYVLFPCKYFPNLVLYLDPWDIYFNNIKLLKPIPPAVNSLKYLGV